MKTVITIVAASAVLSASLCAGFAATDGASSQRAQASAAAAMPKAEAPALRTAWVDPAPKADTACRDAGWPYRAALCAAKDGAGEAPARKVRVISTAAPASLAQR